MVKVRKIEFFVKCGQKLTDFKFGKRLQNWEFEIN
jgi:hypothetical protein